MGCPKETFIFYLFDSKGHIVDSRHLLLDDDLPLSIKKDFIEIVKNRKSMNLSYFYKTPFVCGDFLVTEGIYQSGNAVICADLSNRTYYLEKYKEVGSLSFWDLGFPKYLDEDKVVCLFSSPLYEELDEESKMMLDDRSMNILKNDGFVLVVYHLKGLGK